MLLVITESARSEMIDDDQLNGPKSVTNGYRRRNSLDTRLQWHESMSRQLLTLADIWMSRLKTYEFPNNGYGTIRCADIWNEILSMDSDRLLLKKYMSNFRATLRTHWLTGGDTFLAVQNYE